VVFVELSGLYIIASQTTDYYSQFCFSFLPISPVSVDFWLWVSKMRQQDSQRRLMAIPSPWFDQGSKDGSEALEVLPTSEEVAAVRTRCEIMYTEQVQVVKKREVFCCIFFFDRRKRSLLHTSRRTSEETAILLRRS
jgi:hypothetical protein